MTIATSGVRLEIDDALATITLDRPEKRNALSVEMMRALADTLRSLADRADVRVAIVRGNGPAFSAGHDLRELVDRDPAEVGAIFDVCVGLMELIARIPQPVIAEVAGVATAAGCQLVAACDLALAADDARFATPGVKIGLFCTTPMVALSRAIGRKRAMEMLLTGEFIDAPTAAAWGLVNRVVPAAELSAATRALAQQIAAASGPVLGLGKAAFSAQLELDTARAYRYAAEVMTRNAALPDAQEGMQAFLERRAPSWPSRRGT